MPARNHSKPPGTRARKLKIRLEQRGVSLAPIFAGANQVVHLPCPAPPAWCEATVRLAMPFADGKNQAIAGAGAASVVLAEQVVHALIVAKIKLAAATILSLALLISGAAAAVAWAFHDRAADAARCPQRSCPPHPG